MSDVRTEPGVWGNPGTWEELRESCHRLSEFVGDYAGVPIPLGDELPLTLAEGHPMRGLYDELNQSGGVEFELVADPRYDEHEAAFERVCTTSDVRDDERVVNEWFCRQRQWPPTIPWTAWTCG